MIKLISSFVIKSLSFGFDSAISRVIATRALSLIFLFHVLSKSMLFFAKNNINKNAQLLLFQSEKGWSFTTKYSKFAAFSSVVS